ncbi:hypothetical protein BDN72DRAFT_905435, partial [Pluteus cervinus]
PQENRHKDDLPSPQSGFTSRRMTPSTQIDPPVSQPEPRPRTTPGSRLRSPREEIISWSGSAVLNNTHTTGPSVEFAGPTSEAVATAIIALAIFHAPGGGAGTAHLREPLQVPVGVTYNDVPPSKWISIGCDVKIGGPLGRGVGYGPMRVTLREAIHQVTATSAWGVSEPYHVLHVNTDGVSDVERNRTLYGYGVVAIVHVYQLELAPHPVSPFLFAVAMCKSNSVLLLITLEDLEKLDPDKATILHPWFDTIKGPETVYQPRLMTEPLALLFNSHSIVLRNFYTPRTEKDHASIAQCLLSSVLLGHPNVLSDPGICFFADGMNIDLGAGRGLMDVFRTPPGSTHVTGPQKCHETAMIIMRELYDRRLKSVKQVLKRLIFTTTDIGNSTNQLIFELVQARVITWLMGYGYPPGSLEYEAYGQMTGPKTGLYRARLFMKALTDCDLLPADPSSKFEVVLTGMEATHNSADAPGQSLRTCFSEITVYVHNPWLLKNLTKRDEEGKIEFERWWQGLMTGDGYNFA